MVGQGLAALLAGIAQAGSPPAPQLPDIVVTAPETPDPAETRRFVRQVAPPADFNTPMARFDAPVCIVVAGLPSPLPTRIADRMRQTAAKAGMRAADAGCRPNVLVFFTPDPAGQIATLVKKRPDLFAGFGPAEIGRLAKMAGPALAWSTATTTSREGVALAPNANGIAEQQQYFPSRVVTPIRRETDLSVVLIDRPATVGRTSDQLADYAAIRAFTGARPIDDDRSILSLFDTPSAPPTASAQDLAFLRAFYRVPYDRRPGAQRGLIATEIGKPGGR